MKGGCTLLPVALWPCPRGSVEVQIRARGLWPLESIQFGKLGVLLVDISISKMICNVRLHSSMMGISQFFAEITFLLYPLIDNRYASIQCDR
jgi:hypothetical protein